jgi:hypothetical protein
MRFKLSDGTESPHIGHKRTVNRYLDLPEDRKIRKVFLLGDTDWIRALIFLDANGQVLLDINRKIIDQHLINNKTDSKV